MKNRSIKEYLSDIKSKCDVISIFEQPHSVKNVIHYTLNGLPPTYHAFKTTIHTNLYHINLVDFYALLCSGDLNLAAEISKESSNHQAANHICLSHLRSWAWQTKSAIFFMSKVCNKSKPI